MGAIAVIRVLRVVKMPVAAHVLGGALQVVLETVEVTAQEHVEEHVA